MLITIRGFTNFDGVTWVRYECSTGSGWAVWRASDGMTTLAVGDERWVEGECEGNVVVSLTAMRAMEIASDGEPPHVRTRIVAPVKWVSPCPIEGRAHGDVDLDGSCRIWTPLPAEAKPGDWVEIATDEFELWDANI